MNIKPIKKLIIPAAGWGTRFLPMTKVVHKELVPVLNRPLVDLLVDEAVLSGIEEIIIIISERKHNLIDYFEVNHELQAELIQKNKLSLLQEVKKTNRSHLITKIVQTEQLGLGHALMCAKQYIGNEPFAVILGDDLIKSKVPAIKQLIDFYYQSNGANILGVQEVETKNINKYGIVKPKNESEKNLNAFEIETAIEKPEAKDAPSNKAILGRYVFNPEILEVFSTLKIKKNKEMQVVDAFDILKDKYKQKIFAFNFEGIRYDLGSMEGFVKANIDYALENDEIRDEILDFIVKKIEFKK
ncbi:UTP--glucose-1-phosphate uridylyltransferase [Mycoplasmopsis hyopharyngis]|uniref:UTP--glucose-1-phosphate uridylyltransferase n=1 Tax=Mycoplasmopsis hyopharyngis TaxID=29558 RepID=UPI0038736973